MKQSVFLFLFSLGSVFAQVQDYFPLVPGSTWVYRSTNGMQSRTIRVGDPVIRQGQAYYPLDGYTDTRVLIRNAGAGHFNRWDETANAEKRFLSFDGRDFESVFMECKQTGTASEKDESYRGPVGNSQTAREIRYTPGQCADAGITREVYLPYLGLVQRAETSFIGERTMDLVYAQIGGITYINEQNVGFGIAVAPVKDGISARLILNNRTEKELTLHFRSSQVYDFSIRNARGESVYTWSATRLFLQAETDLKIKGEEVWEEVLPTTNLPAGVYSVEGRLVNSDGRVFVASSSVTLP